LLAFFFHRPVNTAIVGGPDDNSFIGAVWVYTSTPAAMVSGASKVSWSPTTQLEPPNKARIGQRLAVERAYNDGYAEGVEGTANEVW
jgi:hypothetical protein